MTPSTEGDGDERTGFADRRFNSRRYRWLHRQHRGMSFSSSAAQGRGARFQGFTLVELMVTIAIAAILAAVALPVYTQYVQKSRRSAAIKTLSAISQAQERFRSNANTYATSLANLDVGTQGVAANDPHYNFAINGAPTANGPNFSLGYTITATPRADSPQAKDSNCAQLRLVMSQGVFQQTSMNSSNADSTTICWPR